MLHSVQVRNNLIGGEKRDILMSAFERRQKVTENARTGFRKFAAKGGDRHPRPPVDTPLVRLTQSVLCGCHQNALCGADNVTCNVIA